jgi:hypothetical protein
MRAIGFSGVIAAITLSSFAHAAERPPLINIGNWSGGSYTFDTTGAFSHCAAGADYLDGIRLMVSVNRQFAWTLGWAHQSWRLQPGEVIPIDLTFDGRGPFHVFARVFQPTVAFAQMPENSELIRLFRGAAQMSVFAQGRLFGFNLTDTSQVLPALVQCVRENIGPAIVASKTPVAPAPPAPAATPSNMSTLASTGPDLHAEASELAMNFVLGAKVDSPKILSKSDTPAEYASFGAAWKANGAAGVVKIVDDKAYSNGIDVAAAVVGADAKECKGKFASARSSDLVDSNVVFRGISSCEDSVGDRSAQYFIVPRKTGGFVLFSVVTSASANKPASSSDQDLIVFRKAALTAAN